MNGELPYRIHHRSLSQSSLNSPIPLRQLNNSRLSVRSRHDYNISSVSPIRSSSLSEIYTSENIPETIPNNMHETSRTMISENLSRVATQANDTVVLNFSSVEMQETVDQENSNHLVQVRFKKTNCFCNIL